MDRFSDELAELNAKYTYMERPRGSPAQQVGAWGRALGFTGDPWGCVVVLSVAAAALLPAL